MCGVLAAHATRALRLAGTSFMSKSVMNNFRRHHQ
jgi:hypothetical protein